MGGEIFSAHFARKEQQSQNRRQGNEPEAIEGVQW